MGARDSLYGFRITRRASECGNLGNVAVDNAITLKYGESAVPKKGFRRATYTQTPLRSHAAIQDLVCR